MCIFNTFKHHQKEGILHFYIFHLYMKTIKGIVTLVIKSKVKYDNCH